MNIVLGSAFRNAAGAQIERWATQCASLDMALESIGYSLRIVAVEGDSTDRTKAELHALDEAGAPISIVTCNHGQRVFESTEESDRLSALSQVGNAILSSVESDDDVLVYVESDLIWKAETIVALIDTLMVCELDVVAPLVFAGDLFYDIFVYRGLDGERFGPFKPYHSSMKCDRCKGRGYIIGITGYSSVIEGQAFCSTCGGKGIKEFPVEIESAGSCLVMQAEVARKCRIRNDQALLGFCKDVRDNGYNIFVDPTQRIYHP